MMTLHRKPFNKETFLSRTNNHDVVMSSATEGGKFYNPDYPHWKPIIGSPDRTLVTEKDIQNARTGDILRNSPYLQSASNIFKDSIIGAEYVLDAQPRIKVLGLSEGWRQEYKEEVDEKFNNWANSPDNWVDSTRKNSFSELLRLAVGIWFATGEIFAVAEYKKDTWSPYATRIQLVENSRVDTPFFSLDHEDKIRKGIEYDIYGAPIAYHIRAAKYGQTDWLGGDIKYLRVPAYNSIGRRRVFHIYEQMFPDQTRGVSRIVAGIKEIKMFSEFKDATLGSAVINAMHKSFIKSEMPSAILEKQMNGVDSEAYSNWLDKYMEAMVPYVEGSDGHKMNGKVIPHLLPNTDFVTAQIGDHHGIGGSFGDANLAEMAALLGLSKEIFGRDFSDVNYSSARAAWRQTELGMASIRNTIANSLANGIFRLWLEEAVMKRHIETMTSRRVPNFYDPGMKDAYTAALWIGTAYGQIDPLKETQAEALALEKGMTSLPAIWRKRGELKSMNYDTLAENIAKSKAAGLTIYDEKNKGLSAVDGGSNPSDARETKESGKKGDSDE